MAKMWRRGLLLAVLAGALAGSVVAQAGEARGGAPADPPGGRAGRAPGRGGPQMQGGMDVLSVFMAAAQLPKGKDIMEKYRLEAEAPQQELQAVQDKYAPQVRQGGLDEAKRKELQEKATAELLPIMDKLTTLRLQLAANLLKAAQEDPKAVTVQAVENQVNMWSRGIGGRGGPGRGGPGGANAPGRPGPVNPPPPPANP